ncbi:hypothetical protein CP973_22495 [Streptomyces albofaciens JCM 4342]|uniref:hypothetical protein n=1 Tax=Streptomyces albofaciens TaxID=66866 RepID=UPI00123B6296|nr:hypothetical protein [Streptomyces albofaciens]KAA6212222.1 hypothetical protein CP973_22495 [Streptomyces albofaciens JCM 4342]
MRRQKTDSAPLSHDAQEGDSLGFAIEDELDDSFETMEIFRVTCPDCAQPIALLAEEDVLPEHALCPTPWNPFCLTVCEGSGRPVSDASATDDSLRAQERDTAVLLTLPEGLDWRRQPFSHVGGEATRPTRVPRMRRP